MPRQKQFDEEEVLKKAMDLFWKQGYSATSVQDLVSHLGINRASLYGTFKDKEKLFLKALRHYRQMNGEGIHQLFAQEPDVRAGFRKLFEMAIEEAVTDPDKKGCFVVNTTTELLPAEAEVAEIVTENKRAFESLFLSYLEQGEQAGQFSQGKDLRSIASLLFTFYNGLRVVSKIQSDREQLSNSAAMVLSLLD